MLACSGKSGFPTIISIKFHPQQNLLMANEGIVDAVLVVQLQRCV